MATTPRLALNLPVAGDFVDVVVELTNQLQKIDDVFDAKTGLNVNHPNNPFDGQLFWKLDNSVLEYRDAAAGQWKTYTHGKNPLGRLAFISSTAASTAISGTQEYGPYFTVNFNAKANRLYAHHWSVTLDHQTGHDTTSKWIVIRADTSGAGVTQSSPIAQRMVADVDDNGSSLSGRHIGGKEYSVSNDSIVTMGLFVQSTVGVNQVLINSGTYHTLSVEDIGMKL